MRNRIILLYVTLIIASACFGQTNINFSHYEIEDNSIGKAQVTDIIEDDFGKIWFTSLFGIYSLDGTELYTHTATDSSNSIKRNDILCAHKDYSGKIWFGSFNGTIFYYKQLQDEYTNMSMKHISLQEYPFIRDFYDLDSNSMLALTSEGIYKYNKYSNQFSKAFTDIPQLIKTEVLSVYADGNKDIWMGTAGKGLLHISSDSIHVSEVQIKLNGFKIRPRIQSILPVNDSQIIIGTSRGVFLLKNRSGEFIAHPIFENLSNVHVKALTVDTMGNIWIGTQYQGLWHARLGEKAIQIQDFQTSGIHITTVNNIFCDSNNRIWLGTQANGLFMYNPNENRITKTTINSGLANNVVSSINQDSKGNIWVGTDGGGITIFNSKLKPLSIIGPKHGLVSSSVLAIEAQQDNMWLSTWHNGIIKINHKTLQKEIFNSSNSGLSYNGVKSISYNKHDKSIIIGTHKKGLCVLSLKNNTIKDSINAVYPDYFPETQNYINQVLVDSHGWIWVATIRNLYYIHNNEVVEVIKNNNTYNPHNPIQVNCIAEDTLGNILAGTNKGTYIYNRKNKMVKLLESSIGEKKNKDVVSILVDKKNSYWLAKNDGLFVYTPKDSISKKILLPDANLGIFFFPRAIFQDKEDNIYIGTTTGMYSFNPKNITWENKIKSFSFSDLFIQYQKQEKGSEFLPKKLCFMDEISIPYSKNTWGVSYSTICFESTESIEFAYKLEGFDKTWNFVENKKEITFTNIPPGTYLLKIKAWQFDIKNALSKTLKVTILPPWWLTNWFRVLFVFTILLILYTIYKLRLRNLERQKILLKKEVANQTDILRENNEKIEEQNTELRYVSKKLGDANSILSSQKEDLEVLTNQLQEDSEELSELNISLKQVNQTNNQLFSLITHDVRNSFISLQEICKKLLNQFNTIDESKKQKQVSIILQAITNTSDVLENLMQWSKTQSKSIESNPEETDLNEIIENIIQLYDHVATNNKILVKYTNSVTDLINVDKRLIDTVIRNIYNNALKFTSKGGLITIKTKQDESNVVIEIKDTGNGIKSDILNQILNKNEETIFGNNKLQGSGLGLLISRQFIEKCNGSLHIDSQTNKGACFTIKLPLKQELNNNVTIYRNSKLTKHKAGLQRIAIIEDNPSILDLLNTYIETEYEVFLFNSPIKFLNEVETLNLDVIISDIIMPKMDGITLCQKIHSHKKLKHIPIVLISSKFDADLKNQVYEAGAEYFMEKPISKPLFKTLIQKICSQKQNIPNAINKKIIDTEENVYDKAIISKFEEVVQDNISNSAFSIEDMASSLNISRSQLYRKVKHYYNVSPKDYLKNARLHTAAELLQYKNSKIFEIAYATGFSDPAYFSRSFIKYYNISPSEYRESLLNN